MCRGDQKAGCVGVSPAEPSSESGLCGPSSIGSTIEPRAGKVVLRQPASVYDLGQVSAYDIDAGPEVLVLAGKWR